MTVPSWVEEEIERCRIIREAKRQAVLLQTPGHCHSCGAPEDALGSCLGVCDPADRDDR